MSVNQSEDHYFADVYYIGYCIF